MLYTVTATNTHGLNGTVHFSNGKTVQTVGPFSQGDGFTPEESIALGFSTCLHETLKYILEKENKQGLSSKVEVSVDLGEENHEYYFDVFVRCAIADIPLHQAETFVQTAYKQCPIAKLMRHSPNVHLVVVPYE